MFLQDFIFHFTANAIMKYCFMSAKICILYIDFCNGTGLNELNKRLSCLEIEIEK